MQIDLQAGVINPAIVVTIVVDVYRIHIVCLLIHLTIGKSSLLHIFKAVDQSQAQVFARTPLQSAVQRGCVDLVGFFIVVAVVYISVGMIVIGCDAVSESLIDLI